MSSLIHRRKTAGKSIVIHAMLILWCSTMLVGCWGEGIFPDPVDAESSFGSPLSQITHLVVPNNLAVWPLSPSSHLTPIVSGETSASCSVQIYSGSNCSGNVVGTGTSDGSGYFSITSSSLSNGNYQFSAKCADILAAVCSSISLPYSVDTVPPSISLSSPSAWLVNHVPDVDVTATYNGASVVTLTSSDVVLNTTGTASCTAGIYSQNSTTKQIKLSNCTGNGTVGVSLAAGTARDTAGNVASTSPASATFTVDNAGITSSSPHLAAGDYSSLPTTMHISFPEALSPTSVSLGDFSLTGSTCSGASLASVSVTGATVSLGVNGLQTCGLLDTVVLNSIYSGLQDIAGNWGTGSGSVTYRMNQIGPTGATFSPVAGAVTSIPSSVTVTFNQTVNPATVSAADFAVSGTCSGVAISGVSSGSTSATVSLSGTSGCTHGQTAALTANFSGIADQSGNAGSGSASSTYVLDAVGPDVTLSQASGVVNSLPTSLVATFSSDTDMSTVTSADVSVSGTCSGASLGAVNVASNTALIYLNGTTSCSNGNSLQVTVNRATVKDLAGNSGSGTVSSVFTLDSQGPSAVLSVTTGNVNSFPIAVTATFSTDTDMSTVTSADFGVGGTCPTAGLLSLTKSANVATLNLLGTALCLLNGQTVSITAAFAGVSDTVGNAGTGATNAVLTLDSVGPTASFAPATGSYNPLPSSVVVTFDSDTDMSTVTSADFSVLGTCSGAGIGTVSKSGNVATVNLTGTTGCASLSTLIFSLNLFGVSDQVGNAGVGAVTSVYSYDNVGPTVSLSVAAGSYNPLPTSVNVTLSADTDMSSVTSADFAVSGTCSGVTVGPVVKVGQVAAVNLNGTASCPSLSTVILTTLNTGIVDTTGNAGIGSTSAAYLYDNIAPSIGLNIAAGTYNPLPSDLNVTFSSDTDMSTVTSANFTLLGTCLGVTVGSVTFSGVVATLHLSGTGSCGLLSTMILVTNLVGVKDTSGNAAIGLQLTTYIQGL